MISGDRIVWLGVLLLGCGARDLHLSNGSTRNLAIDDEIGSICATRADGSYRCWDGDGTPRASAGLPTADYVRVQLANEGLVGLTREGRVQTAGIALPSDLPPITTFRATNMWGARGLCLRSATGAFLYGAYNPDPNFYPDGPRWHIEDGPFTDTTCAFEGLYAGVRADGSVLSYASSIPASDWKQIALSVTIVCGLTAADEVRCVPGSASQSMALPILPPGPYRQVAATFHVACALRADGGIVCSRYDGVPIPGPTGRFAFLDAGRYLLCAIRIDGTSACFRQNGSGGAVLTFEDPTVTAFLPIAAGIDADW
jgi:hypothetical protein